MVKDQAANRCEWCETRGSCAYITGAASAAQNIVKCIKRCGVEVRQIILQSLASSNAILSEDEKQLGTVLVDMGGGTTDVIVFPEALLGIRVLFR